MSSKRMTTPCLDCGRTGITHGGRGICSSCRYRRQRDGTLDRLPLSSVSTGALPVDRAAFDAYCDASWAALMADVHERERVRRSLVLADMPAPPFRETWLPAAPVVAAD